MSQVPVSFFLLNSSHFVIYMRHRGQKQEAVLLPVVSFSSLLRHRQANRPVAAEPVDSAPRVCLTVDHMPTRSSAAAVEASVQLWEDTTPSSVAAVEASVQLCTVWRDLTLQKLVEDPYNRNLLHRRDKLTNNIEFKRNWLRENPPRPLELHMPYEKYGELVKAYFAVVEAEGAFKEARNWASLYKRFYVDVASYPPDWQPAGEYAAWCTKWCTPTYALTAANGGSLAAPAKKQWEDAKAKEAAAKAVFLESEKRVQKMGGRLADDTALNTNPFAAIDREDESQGVSLAVKRWQSAIGRVMKQNRFHKAETQKHKAESERRRRIRQKCKEAKAQKAKQWAPSPFVGIAPAVGKCATEKPGSSQMASDHGKKLASLDERKKRLAAKREEQRQKMAEEAKVVEERMRLLDVGFAINKGK